MTIKEGFYAHENNAVLRPVGEVRLYLWMDPSVQGFSEEQKTLYDEYVYGDATMLIESNRLEGIGNIKQLQWNWWEQIFFGLPIATVNAIFAPVFQAEIDAMMSK